MIAKFFQQACIKATSTSAGLGFTQQEIATLARPLVFEHLAKLYAGKEDPSDFWFLPG